MNVSLIYSSDFFDTARNSDIQKCPFLPSDMGGILVSGFARWIIYLPVFQKQMGMNMAPM